MGIILIRFYLYKRRKITFVVSRRPHRVHFRAVVVSRFTMCSRYLPDQADNSKL